MGFLVLHPYYISEVVSGIFFKISASRGLSMISGAGSSTNLVRRYLIISLLGLMDTVTTLLARWLLISPRMRGLPVRNIQVFGDFSRIRFSERRILC